MKSSTIITLLSGSLFIVSLLFGLVVMNINKRKCKLIPNTPNTTNTEIDLLNKYDLFENIDLFNKYDILDNFNDRINIYSTKLNDCFIICESTNSCLGFIRFHNYCYLKNNSNIKDQTTSKDMNLFYIKSRNEINMN